MPDTVFHLYMAVSVDGFIADAEGSVDWLNDYEADVDYGTAGFLEGVDALLMGRRTYDQVVGFGDWPYAGKRTVVLTSRPISEAPEGVEGTSDLVGAIDELCAEAERVWIVGGATAASACRDLGVLDRIDLFVMPVLLGAGVPLFSVEDDALNLDLLEVETFETGVVALRYAVA